MRKLVTTSAFKSGDTVKKRSQEGPIMRIMSTIGKEAFCVWFDDTIKREKILLTQLEPVDDALIPNTYQVALWMQYEFERYGKLELSKAIIGIKNLSDDNYLSYDKISEEVRSHFINLTDAQWNGMYGKNPRWERRKRTSR